MLTKQDFESVAEILNKTIVNGPTRATVAGHMAIYFSSRSERFDPQKFLKACQIPIEKPNDTAEGCDCFECAHENLNELYKLIISDNKNQAIKELIQSLPEPKELSQEEIEEAMALEE